MSEDSNLEQVTAVLRDGNKILALELLKRELASNPYNVKAMLLVAQIVDDSKTKEKWYRFVLQTEPQNSQAIQ